ncbi:MAG: sensor histidine kinase [Anaerolineales bacterium]|nr:sensor histidine kinase [Anaerolineales bacterium]
MGTLIVLVYNSDTMHTNSSPEIAKAERDPRLFVWFVTLVVTSMYVVTLINTKSVRQPVILFIFTGLTLVHILLHWQLGKIINHPRKTTWYILVQGVLAFMILLFAKNLFIIIALYMILLGEAVGLFGLTRRGLLAAIYYLVLLSVSLINLSGWASSANLLLSTLPIAVFVILFVALYMRQNEAREQAQSLAAKLETANLQLGEYAAQVEELTLAAERQRMARELHDTLSQGLTGLVLQLEAIKAHLEAGRGERAVAIIEQSLARARSTLADSRSVIDDLRAVPAGMPEAMRAKTERFTQATGIPCELSLALGDTTPPPNTSDHLLRVLNEALTNVTRHAQAGQVWVRLEAKNNHLELEIRDDGQGFEPGIVTGAGHSGLLGMRERARLVGGTLEIESGTGRGTRIRLVVPINQEN